MTGNILQNKYCILEILGQSTFSETLLAKDQSSLSSRRYVIKKFRPILGNPQVQETKFLFQKEANILKRLSGKNHQIPRLYEHFMIGEDFYLVREWINGITLKQKVEQQGEIPETEVKQILISILAVLKYIHSYGIVYRQLKPRNIILRQDILSSQFTKTKHLPVPIYFGGVKELAIESQLNQPSLHEYSSPEHKQGKSIYASDLYSLGLTAIYLLTGKTPSQLTWDSKRNQYLWQPEDFNLQTNLARVINRAICLNPQERFESADEMLKALHSESIVISDSIISPVSQPKEQLYLTPEIKITSILFCLGLGVIGIFYSLLNFDFTQLTANNNQDNIDNSVVYKSIIKTSPPKITSSPPKLNQSTSKLDKSYTKSSSSTIKPATSLLKPSKIPSLPIGTTHQEVINTLGNPTQQTQGYWGNSTALLYQNMAVNQYDLGYLVDLQTGTIRQTEICFAESVDDLIAIQQTAQKLLLNNYSPEIEQNIEQVFFNKSDEQYFQANDLEGVVQRNSENNLYIGIWDADFH
jgi:serine/threonine-protein kinase